MGYNYIPKYIRQSENKSPKGVVTASRWNGLFNLLIQQGDHTAEELGKILDYLSTGLEDLTSALAGASTEAHEYASAFEIHLHTNTNPITADKTFAEIRQAIVDGREITLWVSDVQCLKPACKVYESSLMLAVFDNSIPGIALRADVYECSNEDDWYVVQHIELADQAYVDGRANEKLDKTGGVVTGNLGVTGKLNIGATVAVTETNVNLLQLAGDYDAPVRIRNVRTPVADNDAATKKYVDEHGGGGGTSDHSQLTNRDVADQHPITAITGLQTALDGKVDAADVPSLEGYATEAYVQNYHDNTKQDIITDLATIRSGASKGATAVQPESGKGLFSGSYNDLTDKPVIPAAVTEGTVSGWGFTKNTGTYSKPAGGIPKADLAAAVQASLGKADTALQEHQSLAAYRTATMQNLIDVGKQDKLIAGENITIASDGKTISATGGGAETLFVTITDNNGTLSADKSYNDIAIAIIAGIPVLVGYGDMDIPLIGIMADALYFGTFQCDSGDASTPAVVATVMIEITQNGEVHDISTQVETLPNPNAITFTGAVTGSYDGSAPMTVNIPSAVTDVHINSLIDTKLGVIENGSY